MVFECCGQIKNLPPPKAYFSAIIVNNMDTSLQWYTKIFGCQKINLIHLEERGLKQANLQCGNALLELIEIKGSMDPSTILKSKPQGTKLKGFFKFGFEVEDFDGWMSHLEQFKAHIHGSAVTDPNSGKRIVVLLDPDGNRIQLFEQ